MSFTAAELANIANSALDFYIKGPAMAQSIQERPTLAAFKKGQKSFPGGKSDIRRNVKGQYSSSFTGYTHDDTVTYVNPANTKQTNYPWKEIHAGISLTHTELKHDGISVVDSTTSESVTEHSGREMTAITNLLEEKLEDLAEGSARSHNEMVWRDGTQDAKVFPGIQSLVTNDPTVGVKGGIDCATTDWWRNRALTGGNKITASASLQTLTRQLRAEVRQLKRYGGRPSLLPAGSAFLEALELEVTEKGIYTQAGFANNGTTDIGMADISMRGVGTFFYDPTLDDLGLSKFAYFLDPKHIYLDVMDGEDMKTHAPARPAEKYVMYRGLTWTGGMVADQLNCHGVYEVA
jgi:hypothetical protein